MLWGCWYNFPRPWRREIFSKNSNTDVACCAGIYRLCVRCVSRVFKLCRSSSSQHRPFASPNVMLVPLWEFLDGVLGISLFCWWHILTCNMMATWTGTVFLATVNGCWCNYMTALGQCGCFIQIDILLPSVTEILEQNCYASKKIHCGNSR